MKKKSKNEATKSTEILVAEDSPTQATQIKHLLESNNYKVLVAQNGKQAMELLKKQKPSIVISDIMMPEMNGYELCKIIKSNKSTEDIPVILLTRLTDPEEIIEGLSCGADSFITKPYNEKYLISHIEKFLSEEIASDNKKLFFDTKIFFKGKNRLIQAEQQNVIKLMLSIYEGAIHQNEMLLQTQEELKLLNERLESMVEDRTSDLTAEIKLSNQIAERLKVSEEKYHRIFENVQDLYYETSIEGTIIDISPSIEILSKGQYHRDDLIGKSMNDFYSDIDERATLISQIKERGIVSDYEITLKNKDGSRVPCSVSSKILFDAQGRPEKIIGSMRDITRRKRAEETIETERQMLRTLIDNIPFPIYVLDKDCRRVIANKADVSNIGLSDEKEVFGKTDIELFPGSAGQLGYKYDKKVIDSGKAIFDLEEEFVNSDGRRRWLLTTKIPLHDIYGNIIGLVGIGYDITDRKKSESELIKAKNKAEEGDRLKTAFLHNISHEIRTPMNAIVGFSALLSEPVLDEKTRQLYIVTIMESSNHLLAIINDIVDISNIEANLVKLTANDININSTLRSIQSQFLPPTDERGIKLNFTTELSESDALIMTDSTKLTQVLLNLLNNALKFTEKGDINVLLQIKEKFLQFSVADTGIGISEEHQTRIFERFYQVQGSSSRIYEGTGLGLAISKAYVELMGGSIWLSSKPGTGTTFYFTVPYQKQIIAPVPLKVKSASLSNIFKRKRTILVAEDIDSNFKLVTYFLAGINAEIIRAINGKEAVDKTTGIKNIDLILMDIKMPEMDGYTAAKLIRNANIKIPIIAQTAYADDREKAISAGCNGFISKPFDKKELLKVLSEFL